MKLSVVLGARNDNYGGDFRARLVRSVENLVWNFNRTGIDAEIVLVEWNPLSTEPALGNLFSDLGPSSSVPIRVITIPNEIHRRMPGSDVSPMFEYRAKNVGIRRASGEHVVVINPDILMSPKLHDFLANAPLRNDAFYRVDRYDLPPLPEKEMGQEELATWAAQNWTSVKTYWGEIERSDWRRMLANGIAIASLPVRGGGKKHPHNHASGDFLLMSKGSWAQIHGYREDARVINLDSVGVFSAVSIGLDQRILGGRKRIYHQYHHRAEQNARIVEADARVIAEARLALNEGSKVVVDNPDWGLANLDLKETTL